MLSRALTVGDGQIAAVLESNLGHPTEPPPGTHSFTETVQTCEDRDGAWHVSTEEGSGFAIHLRDVLWTQRASPPQPGDSITVYVYHGSTTVGFDLRGERLFLRSEREMNLQWLSFRARMARERG